MILTTFCVYADTLIIYSFYYVPLNPWRSISTDSLCQGIGNNLAILIESFLADLEECSNLTSKELQLPQECRATSIITSLFVVEERFLVLLSPRRT